MGWLLGAGVGFILGGPLGAVVGGAFQHILSTSTGKPRKGTQLRASEEQVFITHLVAIMTKVCMADGNISAHERKAIHDFFSERLHYGGVELRFIDALIEETRKVNPNLHEVCMVFDRLAAKEQRLLLLDLVYQVALADQVMARQEEEAINQVVASLGIGAEEHQRIRMRYQKSGGREHYRTLGLEPNATPEAIKQAYRQLAAQYHPDKVSHLGPELISFAQEKFKVINEAYSQIRRERGI